MYYNGEFLWDNICVIDSHNMNFDPLLGENCFIIGHHIKKKYILEESVNKLLMAGFKFFNIFGEQAYLWAETIHKKTNLNSQIQVEASKVDRLRMSYNLAMLATLKPKSINFVISDDEYFTEYLIEDLHDIFCGEFQFTPHDWGKFRDGFEFNYHSKDAIISVSKKDVLIGFLGEERYFSTFDEAIRYKLFDAKSFSEIWCDISKNY
ncbi:hypothetical protein [Lagierella massiliensis]|uniref:hypothetical protein n=1 Tax=Lagierella massiliensis TaxID=1689303 RepID=UPI0006D7F15C|nr:hypothetical protein [Lagierella massiliensis]